MANLYVDVDGVLLTARHTQAADGVAEFIDFAAAHFQCFWLTTHCKGNAATALHYVARFLPASVVTKLAEAFRPTNWQTLKTEAIELISDFYWLDDQPLRAEQQVLKTHGVASRLLTVDLRRPDELLRLQKLLRFRLYSSTRLTSLDDHLTVQYGERGTPAREEFEAGFEAFRLGAMLQELRKEKGLTQDT